MAEYLVTDTDLTTVANAIREKAGITDQLSFPTGFAEAVSNISTGGGLTEPYVLETDDSSGNFTAAKMVVQTKIRSSQYYKCYTLT